MSEFDFDWGKRKFSAKGIAATVLAAAAFVLAVLNTSLASRALGLGETAHPATEQVQPKP